MKIRQAVSSDLKALIEVFEGAKQIMRSSGNLHQWNDGYPDEEVVLEDIECGHCFVGCEGDGIVATMALIPGPEPTYSFIDGRWPDDGPYYVIHRIAAVSPGRNSASEMFDWAFDHIKVKGCCTIRIDTHRDNCIMKHILCKYGFSECGIIYLQNGDPRDAYILSRD